MSDPAPKHLWQAARDLLSQIWAQFGGPRDVLYQIAFTKPAHAHLCRWLRGAEALLRALLFIDAVALCVGGKFPKPTAHAARPRMPREKRAQNPDHPETWRVRFRVLDPVPRPGGAHRQVKASAPQLSFDAWPLAERAEALLRVLNNPLPYTRRLASKLRRHRDNRLRVNASSASHVGIIMPFVWDEACMTFLRADTRLCNSS